MHNQNPSKKMRRTNFSGNSRYKRIIYSQPDDQTIDSQQKNRTCQIVNSAVPADHRLKLKESEKRDKYLNLAWELKKTVEHESDGDTNCSWRTWHGHQSIGTGTGELGKTRTREDYPNHSIAEMSQNTKKSDGDVLSLRLQWKTIS